MTLEPVAVTHVRETPTEWADEPCGAWGGDQPFRARGDGLSHMRAGGTTLGRDGSPVRLAKNPLPTSMTAWLDPNVSRSSAGDAR